MELLYKQVRSVGLLAFLSLFSYLASLVVDAGLSHHPLHALKIVSECARWLTNLHHMPLLFVHLTNLDHLSAIDFQQNLSMLDFPCSRTPLWKSLLPRARVALVLVQCYSSSQRFSLLDFFRISRIPLFFLYVK